MKWQWGALWRDRLHLENTIKTFYCEFLGSLKYGCEALLYQRGEACVTGHCVHENVAGSVYGVVVVVGATCAVELHSSNHPWRDHPQC